VSQTRLILIGGFLGAGKTTLLAQAGRRLRQRGLRVGVITNDQGDDLVDTALLEERGEAVQEVSGGCFCCRFGCLLSASDALTDDLDSEVLLAEPVGSCMDISATVLQPLKEYYPSKFKIAPFSVLVDPDRLRESVSGGTDDSLPNSVSYIFGKQLEEADLIVLNKVDLLDSDGLAEVRDLLPPEVRGTPVLQMSAIEGRGVEAWLDIVMDGAPAGSRIAEMDYDTYAEGEAALGWLNGLVRLRSAEGVDWKRFCGDLLENLRGELNARSAGIAHVKLLLAGRGGSFTANLTSSRGRPIVRGDGEDPAAGQAMLTINARVNMDPEDLRCVVVECLQACAGAMMEAEFEKLDSFSPSRPRPEHRFSSVVED